MSGPSNGKYIIVLAGNSAPPPFPVGADPKGPESPVIAGGRDHIWTVRKVEDGNYILILEQGGPRRFGIGIGEDVVVGFQPGRWVIRKQPHDEYSIEVPSGIRPTRAWTLDSSEPGTEVKLRIFELPRPGQLWKFFRVYE